MPKNSQRADARRWVVIAAVVVVVLMLALLAAWKWTPLEAYAEPRVIARWLRTMAHTPWMPPLVALTYVCASLLMFPNTVLSLAIIMALGPVEGAAYAFGGSLCGALAGYTIGRRGGKRVEKLHFKGFDKLTKQLRNGGFKQVLMLRVLPVAPFTVTNIVSGAARVPVLAFAAATLVGIAPYIITFAFFGRQARRLLSDPGPMDITATVAIAAVATFALWHAHRAAARAR